MIDGATNLAFFTLDLLQSIWEHTDHFNPNYLQAGLENRSYSELWHNALLLQQ